MDEEGNHIITTIVVKKIICRVKRTKTEEEQIFSEITEERDFIPREACIEEKVNKQDNKVAEKRII